MKKIGVLGGMGPQASIRFYQLLIDVAMANGATRNADFPNILLANIPVPDLIGDQVNEDMTVGMVEDVARDLRRAGAELLAMPCNTMHLYVDRFQEAAGIPFVSMIDAVMSAVQDAGYARVGVLGTPTIIQSGLYHDALARIGVEVLQAEGSAEAVIQSIIAGNFGADEKAHLNRLCEEMIIHGAQSIVLGCTELPLVKQEIQTVIPLIDSTFELARVVLAASR